MAQPTSCFPRCRPASLQLFAALLLSAACSRSLPAQATHSLGNINFGNADHSPHTDAEHLVQGIVSDKSGKALPGVMVYLKNARTSTTEIVFTDEKGAYRFGPLPLETDYSVWAKSGNKTTAAKMVSAFSTGPVTIQIAFP